MLGSVRSFGLSSSPASPDIPPGSSRTPVTGSWPCSGAPQAPFGLPWSSRTPFAHGYPALAGSTPGRSCRHQSGRRHRGATRRLRTQRKYRGPSGSPCRARRRLGLARSFFVGEGSKAVLRGCWRSVAQELERNRTQLSRQVRAAKKIIPSTTEGVTQGYGWMTVSVRLITNASRRSRKSAVTSANASGRSVLMPCPAS